MNAKELREQRAALVARMQELTQGLNGEAMSPEASEQWDKMDKDQADMLSRAETLERVERTNNLTLNAIKEQPVKRANFIYPQDNDMALRAWFLNASGKGHLVSPEMRNAFDRCGMVGGSTLTLDLVKRDQSRTVGEGGYSVNGELIQYVEKALKDFSGARQACKVLRTSNGAPLAFPVVDDTGNSATLEPDLDEVSNTSVVFTQKTLGAYKYASLVAPISIELLQDSAINIQQFLGELLGERVARATNAAFTMGTGSSQPQGYCYASTKGVDASAADEIVYDELIDLIHSVDVSYRKGGQCAFTMHDLTLAELRKLLDGNDRPIWQPSLLVGQPDTLLGYPVVTNNDVPAIATGVKAVTFGDHSKALIRDVMPLEIKVLVERYAEYGAVGMLALYRGDSVLLNTAAVKHIEMN